MPVAAALGLSAGWFRSPRWPLPMVEAARTAMIGIRSLDAEEREVLRHTPVRVVTHPHHIPVCNVVLVDPHLQPTLLQ